RQQWAGVAGYFVNPVVFRADLSGDLPFAAHLERVKRKALEVFRHQDYPFPLLVERLQPDRDLSMSPLLQAVFALQKAHLLDDEGLSSFAVDEAGKPMRLAGIELEPLHIKQRVAQFDLTLLIAESDAALRAAFQYRTDLFDPAIVRAMADQ